MDAIDELERGRASYAARAWTDAHRSLSLAAATARARRGRPRAARDVGLHARAATTSGRRASSAPITRTWRPASRARGALRVLARPQPRAAGRDEPRERLARPRAAAARPRRGRQRRARLPADPGLRAAGGRRRARGGARDRGRGGGDRRALRRRRPARARGPRAGQRAGQAGPGRRGPRAARRGDAGGHGGRALADRHRPRLLQRDRRLPGRVRAAARAGVDRRADALVRAAARHGRVHRQVPGAPRGDHAAARRVARRARGGAARARALRAGADRAAAGAALYRQGEVHRLRGELAAAEAAYREASRCGWEPQPGLALLRLAAGSAGAAAAAIRRVVDETGEPLQRARLLPAAVEILLAVGDAERRARRLPRARRALRALREPRARRDGGARARRPSRSPTATRARRSWRCATPARCGRSSTRPTRPRAPACWSGWRAARRATRRPPRSSSTRRATRSRGCSAGAGPRPRRVAHPQRRRGGTHGLTARELQVLRRVAGGETNKAIAAALVLSERTVDRHVSNIFTKLRRLLAQPRRPPTRTSTSWSERPARGWNHPRRRAAEVGWFPGSRGAPRAAESSAHGDDEGESDEHAARRHPAGRHPGRGATAGAGRRLDRAARGRRRPAAGPAARPGRERGPLAAGAARPGRRRTA